MAQVTSKQYSDAKSAFLRKHDDWKVETSSMDEYGRYHKTYICSNGDVWCEVNEPTWQKAEAEVEIKAGLTVNISQDVKLFRTEGWSNKKPESIICYEKY